MSSEIFIGSDVDMWADWPNAPKTKPPDKRIGGVWCRAEPSLHLRVRWGKLQQLFVWKNSAHVTLAVEWVEVDSAP